MRNPSNIGLERLDWIALEAKQHTKLANSHTSMVQGSTESSQLASWKLHSPAWMCSDSEWPFQSKKLQHEWWIFPFDSSAVVCGSAGTRGRFLPALWAGGFHLVFAGNRELWDLRYLFQTWVMDESILYVLPRSCHCPDFKAGLVPSPCSRSSPGSISLLQSFFPHLAELWTTTNSDSYQDYWEACHRCTTSSTLLGFLFL